MPARRRTGRQRSRAGLDPTQDSIIGLILLGQLVIVVLGALTITSEYSTQAIRGSLTAMPRRGILFAAKGAVFAAGRGRGDASLAVFASFFTGQRLLAGVHAGATLSQPGVLRAILATALFMVLCGLFSYGLGAVIRSTAGTITTAYGILLLLPQLARALPTPWYDDAIRWLPGGQFDGAITSSGPQPIGQHMFGTWGELAVFAGYTLVALIAGRDPAAPQGRLSACGGRQGAGLPPAPARTLITCGARGAGCGTTRGRQTSPWRLSCSSPARARSARIRPSGWSASPWRPRWCRGGSTRSRPSPRGRDHGAAGLPWPPAARWLRRGGVPAHRY